MLLTNSADCLVVPRDHSSKHFHARWKWLAKAHSMPDDIGWEPERVDLANAYAFALDQITTASEAIAHPLGFVMLQQVPDRYGGYRRIHIWRRDRASRSIPHSHSGNLRSTILAGRMRNTLWQVKDAGPEASPIIQVEKGGHDRRIYRLVGNGRCVLAARADYGPGDSYKIPAGAYHSNEALTDICVTFAERYASAGGLAQVAISPLAAAAAERAPMVLGQAERRLIAEELRLGAASLVA